MDFSAGRCLILVIPPVGVVRRAVVVRASHTRPLGDRPAHPGPFTTVRITAGAGWTYEVTLLDTALAAMALREEAA
jgi:hypothetical protein